MKQKNKISNTLKLFFWDDRFNKETDLNILRKIMMLNYLFIALGLFLVPFGILAFIQKSYLISSLNFTTALGVFIARYYYIRTKNYKFLTYFTINLVGVLFLFLIYSGGANFSGPLWSYLFPVSVMFLIGKKGKYYTLAFLIIVIIIFLIDFSNSLYSLSYKLRFIGSFSAVSVLSYFTEHVREVMQQTLLQKNIEVEKSLRKLEQKEKELQIAKEKAERSDRLKSDFLAQMSHEIRTPINTIMNYTSLLKMEFGAVVSEDNSGSFTAIHNAAHRLLRTIDLILNISDLEAGTYEPKFENINLPEQILTPVINEFRQAAINKYLFLSLSYPTEKKYFMNLDSYTVYQAISNLVDNSIKYTEKGGIKVTLEEDEDNYLVKIIDSGIGMSKEYLPKLFGVFSQEEQGYTRKYEGNGLGLSLVKKYCELNNISIDVESIKGKGSTFTLTIPKLIKKNIPEEILEKEIS